MTLTTGEIADMLFSRLFHDDRDFALLERLVAEWREGASPHWREVAQFIQKHVDDE